MRRLAALALFLTLACATSHPPITTIIVVRHADRESVAADSPLSAAGIERANELARVLAGVKVSAVFATPFVRTQQTIEPLARARGLQPIIVKTGDDYARNLVADILAHHAGQTVVVASHSDTIPNVLRQLGITDPPPITLTQYDDFFACVVVPGEPPRLLSLRYGAVKR